jgi:hypothetical protein
VLAPWAFHGTAPQSLPEISQRRENSAPANLPHHAQKKNSLVNNINKRKAAGTRMPKAKSAVSAKLYAQMKRGWKRASQSETPAAIEFSCVVACYPAPQSRCRGTLAQSSLEVWRLPNGGSSRWRG